MRALIARRDGRPITDEAPRPFVPDDVVKVVDRLYRQRKIDLTHARILRIWGERQIAPDASIPAERGDHRLWAEAMTRLEWPLRVMGIVAGPQMAMQESAR